GTASSNGAVSGCGVITITGGKATVTLTSTAPVSFTISFVDSAHTGLSMPSSSAVTFSVGAAASLRLGVFSASTATIGTSLTANLTAYDQYGNIATGFSGSAGLTAGVVSSTSTCASTSLSFSASP